MYQNVCYLPIMSYVTYICHHETEVTFFFNSLIYKTFMYFCEQIFFFFFCIMDLFFGFFGFVFFIFWVFFPHNLCICFLYIYIVLTNKNFFHVNYLYVHVFLNEYSVDSFHWCTCVAYIARLLHEHVVYTYIYMYIHVYGYPVNILTTFSLSWLHYKYLMMIFLVWSMKTIFINKLNTNM